MQMNNKEYNRYVQAMAEKSPMLKNMAFAFVIGGAICTIGQLILNGWSAAGLDKTEAATATSISMILLGALFTGLGLYCRLAKYAGAGTLVPITGFSNAVVSPAIEFKSEGFVTGMAAKMFVIAGPVIVYGISSSVLYGLIYWITTLF